MAAQRLVGQHGERRARAERSEDLGHPWIRPRVQQEPCVVDRQKALERVGRRLETGRGKRAGDERRRPVADHAADRLFGEGPRAARFEQHIRRVGYVTAGIDQRSIEVEHEELIHEFEDLRI